MRKGVNYSVIAFIAMVLVFSTVLAACGGNNNKENNTAGNNAGGNHAAANEGAANEGGEKLAAEQILRMNMHSEPPSLDPGQAQDQVSFTILNGLLSGLTQMNEAGEVEPAVAEKWDISEDGLKYTFYLRKDAKWTNGDPVTAKDFEFSWKRVLDPNFQPAPPYAYQLFYIKNAAEYNSKTITDPAQVGVKALDEYTLEVELAKPAPYFLSLVSFVTYLPVHPATAQANPAFAAEAATMVTNGAFKLDTWKHSDSIIMKKSDSFYAKDDVKLNEVHFSMVQDSATELKMYQTDKIHYAGMPLGEIPLDQIPALQQKHPEELGIKGIASTYYYVFNVTSEPFKNLKIRQAFAKAIDRKLLTERVTMGGELPAFGFVPPGIKGESEEYRTEHKDDYFAEGVEEAKTLLAEGMAEEGYTALPEITLIYNTSDRHKRIATAIADMWSKAFDVQVKMEAQEFGVFLKNRTNLNYQVARSGWGADYNDPMTFLDMWTSDSGNNDSGFKNQEYDKLIGEAYSSQDNKVRIDSMAKAEQILIDNMVVLPLFYYSNVKMLDTKVKGMFIDYKGDVFFNNAYIVE